MPAKARVRILDEPYVPRAIGIEVTNICCNDCPYCPRSTVMKRRFRALDGDGAERLALAIGPAERTWAELGLAGDPSASPTIREAVEGLRNGGFRRIHFYTSLACSDMFVDDVIRLFEAKPKGDDFLVTTSPHFWQMKRGEIALVPWQTAKRWGDRVRRLVAAGVPTKIVAPVPYSNVFDTTRRWIAQLTDFDEKQIAVGLGTDLFTLYGLEPRCEVTHRHCPAGFLTVTVDGMLSMCCHDMKPAVVFGSIMHIGFMNCLNEKLGRLSLMRKDRAAWPDTCKRCASAGSMADQLKNGFWQ